jgi:hypothetical protein
MALDPLARPPSVFALQKELAREGERRYSQPPLAQRVQQAVVGVSRLLRPGQ